MSEDNIVFASMDSYRGGGGKGNDVLTIKSMIMRQIEKCISAGGVEFKGGYWNIEGYSDNNFPVKKYIPSTYEVFINSVKALDCLLKGYYDDEMIAINKKIMEEDALAYEEIGTNNKEELVHNGWFEYSVQLRRKQLAELILLSKRLAFFEEEQGEEEV